MKAVILAAGMGKRLGKLTEDVTKCMVEINGKKIIDYTIHALQKVGIKDIVVVVGYKKEKLMDYLKKYNSLNIEYIVNPIYDTTNNIYSLGLAKDILTNNDCLLIESDVIFDIEILEKCLKVEYKNIAVVAKYKSWMDGTVTLLSEDNSIKSFISKNDFNWQRSSDYYKTVNIYKLSQEYSTSCFVPFLESYIKAIGTNEYYEDVLKLLAFIGKSQLKALKVEDLRWYEIDDAQDLDIASVIFSEEKNKYHKLMERYGGYWRFPGIIDFCYLVNPYFPNDKMLSEFNNEFHVLINNYPSGQKTHKILASSIFQCNIDEIVVGNGASEIIKNLSANLDGIWGITVPTFNEYINTIPSNKIRLNVTSKFSYNIFDLQHFVINDKIKNLILINPDNPSGHYITKDEILKLLDFLKEKEINLILDESFVDFVDGSSNNSFLQEDIIDKYDNLIVIKSLGKSFGIPGMRLGVMVSHNTDLVKKMVNSLPIWNINSLAEYFLQKFIKYSSSYYNSCKIIAENREKMISELSTIKDLKIFSSKANYLCIQLNEGVNLNNLLNYLLNKHGLLLKDLRGKKGIDNRNIMRIAIRNNDENALLLEGIKTFLERD